MSDLDTLDLNIANTLREIASNSPKTVGKILKKIQKAARNGKDQIKISISEEEYSWLDSYSRESKRKPVMIEKLLNLGFRFEGWNRVGFFNYGSVIVYW